MQDRVPLYPGRVTLTPVSGQTNTYDMTMADQPQVTGTPLNKANLLSDAAAAAVWPVAADRPADPVPSQAFEHIGARGRHLLADYTTQTDLDTRNPPIEFTLTDDFENYDEIEIYIVRPSFSSSARSLSFWFDTADNDHLLASSLPAQYSTGADIPFVPVAYIVKLINSAADGHIFAIQECSSLGSGSTLNITVSRLDGSGAFTGRKILVNAAGSAGGTARTVAAGVRIQIYGTRM